MTKVTNTTKEAKENPLLGLLGAMNVEAQEKRGQSELVNSCQLPIKYSGTETAIEMYEKIGITVIGKSKSDDLFLDVDLPVGWKKRGTDSLYWSELVDDKERVRATFFYKSAMYDRDASVSFETRFDINIVRSLPQSETGHYEKKMVKVFNPNYKTKKEMKDQLGSDGVFWGEKGELIRVSNDGMYQTVYQGKQPKYITEEQNVWIPKYKDSYDERNNTPHYFEVTDCGKVIFTTKDNPVFFKEIHTEENHYQWWTNFDNVQKELRIQAVDYLNKNYPDWKNINAYWD